MSKPAAGYTRLSQDGISIEQQKASIRDYCRNHDLDLTTIYDDGQHASGYSVDERPEYQALRECVRNQDVAAITLRDIGRLGRDFDERMLFIIDLRKAGIELHSVERGQRDLADPYSVAVEGIQAASDDAAKRAEIERAKHEIERRLEAGYDQGRPPFGMQFDDDGRYWVPGEEFSTALEVIDLRDAGDSYRAIESETGVPYSTARRIVESRERYPSANRN